MTTKLATVVADFTTQLATAMAIGATTASLQSATDDDGNALPSGVYFFAIDGNNSQKEHIVCTLTGTSLTNISSISRQGVQTSGCMRAHRVGSTVTLTDFATLRYINDYLTGATALDHTNPLTYDGTASLTTPNQLATKAYVDGVAIAGGANASSTVKGISKLSVDPVSGTNPIAVGDNDTRVPTATQTAALAGTSGTTPSGSNKFVDNADTGTSGAGKVLRLDGSGNLPALSAVNLTGAPALSGANFTNVAASYVFGVTSALLATTAANNDVSVTTTFTPRLVHIRYWIQGFNSISTNFESLKGVATFNGTTLISNDVFWYDSNISDNGQPAGNVAALSLFTDPTSTSSLTIGTSGGISLTLSIPTVSSTGFTIRRATVGSGHNARANISYEAFA